MRHQQGPTKRMAPSPSPETSCPHKYMDDDELVLSVDCNSCAGAHDLANQRCYSGILNILGSGAQPGSIVLMRYIHKRYSGDAVKRAIVAASELSSIRRSIAALEPASDKRCRTCPASAHRVLLQARLGIVENPLDPPADRAAMAQTILEALGEGACERASACVSRVLQSGA